MKRVIVSGGTGLIGVPLVKGLLEKGYEVVVLTRNPTSPSKMPSLLRVHWDGENPGEWCRLVEGCQAVINLAGENIGAGLWTRTRKERIVASRTNAGRVLERAIEKANHKPEKFIQASAIGYYGNRDDQMVTEKDGPGNGFLADTCRQWEASSRGIESMGVCRVVIRMGIVFSKKAGALSRLLLPVRFNLGGPLGCGGQYWSWISQADVTRALLFLLEDREAEGIYNLTAPEPATMNEIGKSISFILHKPYWLSTPAFVLRRLMGEMSCLVLDSQRVIPERLLQHGFQFAYPVLEPLLMDMFTQTDISFPEKMF